VVEIFQENINDNELHEKIIAFSNQTLIPQKKDFKISIIKKEDKLSNEIEFYVQVSSSDKMFLTEIPKFLKIKGSYTVKIKTKYYQLSKNKRFNDCAIEENIPQGQIIIGGGNLYIGHRDNLKCTFGSFLVQKREHLNKKNIYYGLTTAHNMPNTTAVFYSNGNPDHKILISNTEPKRNKSLDYCLIKIREKHHTHIVEGMINHRNINFNYIQNQFSIGTPVFKYGMRTKYTKGFIKSDFVCEYNKAENNFVTGLVEVKSVIKNCLFSNFGDSGSLVVDDKNRPVGIIKSKALNDNTSLIVPIHKIFEDIKNNYQLILTFKLN